MLLSQLSAQVLGQAVLSYHPNGNADLSQVRSISVILAVSAGLLGVAFGSAVLLITRKKLAAEIDVYRATGVPFLSTLRFMVRYHPVRPLAWLTVAAAAAVLGDSFLSLNVFLPLDLAVFFAALLLGWVALLTAYMFNQRGFKEGKGRVG